MPRNGSGGYVPPSNSFNPATNGVAATAVDWNATLTDIAAAIQQSISADGQTPITGNLAMGGNKLTGLAAGSGTGQSLRFEQLFSQGSLTDIASAATVDIGAQMTNFLRVTGTTSITSFGTNYNGPRFLIFAAAVTLTHSATLVLPTAANITTAANDALIAVPISGGWQVVAYQKADGSALSAPLIAATTAGTSTAYTLTPSPAITAYAANQSFWVTFHTASGAAPTLQISGVATPPNLVKQDVTGAYVNIQANDIPTNHRSRVTLISTTQALVEELPPIADGGGVQGTFKNLQLSANGTTSTVNISADAVAVRNSAGALKTLISVSLTPSTGAASGAANSLDTGTWAFSTWYYVYVIWNGTTIAALFSLSATAPTLPSGYTHFARVGAIRTQSATNFNALAFRQYGRRAQYLVAAGSNVTALPQMATSASTAFWTAVGVSSFVPATAGAINVLLTSGNAASTNSAAAPNSAYGAPGSITNPPPITINGGSASGAPNSSGWLQLESTSIFWGVSGATSSLFCIGWEDNL